LSFFLLLANSRIGIQIATGTIIPIKGVWNNTKSKRFCRKYLADLNKIAPIQA
jgi:hypothetical protein